MYLIHIALCVFYTCRPEAGGVAQSRLILGMYNIYPAVGTIFPGGHQQITVECLAENPGHYEEVGVFPMKMNTPSIEMMSSMNTRFSTVLSNFPFSQSVLTLKAYLWKK